ncbi:MAG: hypothetical protein IJT08_00330 [Alphaproteobacteria bacterium]|nr:hypothetical protein [Alphaproteobacteria bacterium]
MIQGGAFSIRIQIQGIPQPTNAQAAAEANANVDVGHTKSATTKWFVAVFSGFAHAGNNYVTPVDFDGFPENKNTNKNAIIKFDRHDYAKAHNSTCRSPMSCNCPSAEACFWDAFRKIASDPVGMVLLYRILIEVTRNTEANDV